MNNETFRGVISYVSPDKNFATIEYERSNKQKSVNCKTGEATAEGSKKPHHFRLGDEVSFELKVSDRGDKLTAFNVKFLYNTSIQQLVSKAQTENRFSGYLKVVDDRYFVKEVNSYLLFPLKLSPWEKAPAASASNEAISFRLLHLDKPNNLAAELFSHTYLPAFKKAEQHFKHEIPVDAVVYRISPYGIYVHLFEDKISARLERLDPLPTVGDTIQVLIQYLSPAKIVITRAPGMPEGTDES